MNYLINIITLDKTSEPSTRLLHALNEHELNTTFYDAVDGRNEVPALLYNESINQDKSVQYRLSKLHSAEIGAYLSHYRCIKNAYETNVDKICVFEDDINIESNFDLIFRKLLALPDTYEFIRLMELKRCKRKILMKVDEKHTLTRPEKGTLGAQGYILNRSGMKKVIDNAMPIWKPIDKYFDHYWELDLQSFSVEPHIIWETPSASSIKKPNFKPKVSLKNTILWNAQKLLRSIRRKIYILKRRKDFFPMSKPLSKMGKTARKG